MSKIYVIGIGPGAYDQMTGKAIRAMNESDAIIGYTVYVDLVKEYFPGKEFMTTPMKKEVDRCVLAFEEAKKGKTVSMICSGDAGVYGMAGLMYAVGVNYPETELEIIPDLVELCLAACEGKLDEKTSEWDCLLYTSIDESISDW